MRMSSSRKSKANTSLDNNIVNEFEEGFHQDLGQQIIDDIYLPPPPIQPLFSADQTGKRLLVENIELFNFKSYGGTRFLGPFHKSFNSIVGPNGSGKSNVIDAIVFIFGFRAQKIRSNKISSVIHNSESLPNCDTGRVTVNFVMIDDKGGDDHELLDDTRFSISRIVHKDNSSYYQIDGRRVQFKEVSKKLQDFGIDLRYNRFLILQGEVEQISLMKPISETGSDVGMLEYLEDIVGTSRFKEPIEKLTLINNTLNEQRTQCYNRMKLCQRELKVIGESKDEAVRALELENMKKIEKYKIYQCKAYRLIKKMEKDENEYSAETAKMDAMVKEEQEFDQKKAELENEEKSKGKEHEKLKKNLAEFKEKFIECEKNDYYLTKKRDDAKDKLKKLTEQIEKDSKKLDKLRDEPTIESDDIEQFENEKVEIAEELKTVSESMNVETETVHAESADLIQKRDELDRDLMKFKDEQTDKLNRMNEAHNNLTIYKQKSDNARFKVEQLTTKLKRISDETEEKEKFIERYQNEIPQESKKLEDLHKNLLDLERKHSSVTEQLNLKNEELVKLKQNASKAENKGRARNVLMQASSKGTLQGIFGRLGDLGAIDEKYDIAVSTACGRLQNFVVDTIDNAQKCVEFLKQNNHPTVTFIALDKMRVRWRDGDTFPEGVPRLFDLVRISDERIRAAFYFALGDTLVAKDMEQACRIAYGKSGKYRVVTLRGEMIEVDGSMSGGGKPRSGGMGSTIAESANNDSQTIELYEHEVDALRTERKQLDIQIDNLRRDSHNLEKDIKILKDKMNSYRLDVKDNEQRVQQCRDNLQQQKLELEQVQDNPEIEKAEVLYQKAKEIYERELAKMDSKQEELKSVDDEIRERLNQKLEPIKKKKKSLEKKLKDIQSKLNQILSERKTKELAMKKMEDTLEQNQKAKVGFEEEVESVKAQIVELEELAKDIGARYLEATEKSQSFEKEFGEIQKQVRELCERVRQIKSEKLDLKHEMEKKFKVLNEKRQHLAAYRHELNSIVLDEIDDLKDEVVEDLMNSSNSGTAEQEHLMEVDGDNQQPNNDVEEGIEESAGDAASVGGDNSTTNKNSKLPRLTADELEVLEIDSIEKTIATLEAELKKLSPNFAAIEEYRKKRSDYRQRVSELMTTTQQRDTYMDHVKSTKDKRLKEFKVGFTTISRKLKELYRTITMGGDADLEFVDSMDPFSEGINFAVRPNKKSWKNNINLSGGEKTLASLALIFALHYFKPSPLYIMDEIDAALDFKNVSIIAGYIEKRTRNTQFLIISLRSQMYEKAQRLIGIYKTHNITKSIPFDPAAYEAMFRPQLLADSQSQTNGLTNGQLSSQQSQRSTKAGFTTGTTTGQLSTFSQLSSQSSQCDSAEQNSIIPSATNGVVTTTITQSSMDVDEC